MDVRFIKPGASETVSNLASVMVHVKIHEATMAPDSGPVRIDVRPYGSADFPSGDSAKHYLSRSVTGNVGSTAGALFDLSDHGVADWQAAATFSTGLSGKRSAWVRFGGLKRISSPSLLNIEAESLAATASAAVAVQPMQQFGPGWSDGAHLFWGAGSVGATLTVAFDVPATATYAVELYMTRAPDYGNVEVQLATLKPLAFSGFAPKVTASGPIQMGTVQLTSGTHTIQFRVTGRYQDSKGYRVGFDRIRLYPQ